MVGSLNQFHAGMTGLGRSELQTAQALADAARIAVLQQRAIHRSEVVVRQLRAARTSQIIIEQAKGVLPERLQISAGDAFELLRRAERCRKRLLSDLAREIATGGADAAELLQRAPGERSASR